ncbi:MAG: NUDIX hydrolase [Micrococcales bacterium]
MSSNSFRPANPISANHVKHRETARVILKAADGRMLMIFTHWDPGTGLPPRWLTPGGGIDAGETVLQAAVRELHEETGLKIEPEVLGEPVHRIEFQLEWAGGELETGVAHFYQHEVSEAFELDDSNWMPDEHRDIVEYRWWQPAELIASGELIGPPGLREWIASHL